MDKEIKEFYKKIGKNVKKKVFLNLI